MLASQHGVSVLAFSDPEGYGAELGEIAGVTIARVELRQMMALVERCRLLVCNDSGPMHVAGAMGIPVVALFGSGVAPWFSPLGDGHQLLAADSAHADVQRGGGVKDIPVGRVLLAVTRALKAKAITPD